MRSYCCATMSWALATNSELMRHEPHPRAMSAEAFQVRAVSIYFLMVGMEQAYTRSSRLAAFGATGTISQFSARRKRYWDFQFPSRSCCAPGR